METTASVAVAGGLTRSEVARILGISNTTLRRREGSVLHPRQGPRGEHLFDPVEVEAVRQAMAKQPEPMAAEATVVKDGEAPPAAELVVPVVTDKPAVAAAIPTGTAAPETTDDVAATAFALFEAEKSPAQVVIETKIGPDVVERLYETWLRFRAMDTTSTAAQSRTDELAAAAATARGRSRARRGRRLPLPAHGQAPQATTGHPSLRLHPLARAHAPARYRRRDLSALRGQDEDHRAGAGPPKHRPLPAPPGPAHGRAVHGPCPRTTVSIWEPWKGSHALPRWCAAGKAGRLPTRRQSRVLRRRYGEPPDAGQA